MATVRSRGKFFYARWREKDGSSAEKGGFVTAKEAKQYGEEQEALIRAGKNTKPSALNLTVFQFVTTVWQKTLDVRDQTKLDYERSLNSHILPKFGVVPMKDIKQVDIKIWQVELKNSGLSERTVEKHINLLASILKLAVENQYLHNSPFTGWKRGKAQKRNKVVPLSFQQVTAIANGLMPQYRIMVWIGYFTGMRPSEVLGLTWAQIDFDNEEIEVKHQISRDTSKVHEKYLKTEASYRTIGLSQELAGLLRAHQAQFGLGPNGLILKNRLGGVLRYPDAASMFRKSARAIGMKEGEGMHQLRHTCVSTLIAEGGNMKEIQGWVGHSTITETMDTYGHLFPNSMGALSKKLDKHAKQNATMPTLRAVN